MILICPALHPKVAGTRGKGTGARKPYLKRNRQNAFGL